MWPDFDKYLDQKVRGGGSGGSGGGGVSSWNDLPDKPFGEEGSLADLEVLLPLAEHRIEYIGSGYGTFKYEQIDLTVGETYTVLFDGVEYVCAAQEIPNLTDYVYLGGEDSRANNGIPFSFVRQRDSWSCSVTLSYNNPNVDPETATFTLAVYKGAVRIKTIDPKYLPGGHVVIPITIDASNNASVGVGASTVQKAIESYKHGGNVAVTYGGNSGTFYTNVYGLMETEGFAMLLCNLLGEGGVAGVLAFGLSSGEVMAQVQMNT